MPDVANLSTDGDIRLCASETTPIGNLNHSDLMPADLITSSHFLVSSAINRSNCVGEPRKHHAAEVRKPCLELRIGEAGINLLVEAGDDSSDESSDLRCDIMRGPACRCAHAGYGCSGGPIDFDKWNRCECFRLRSALTARHAKTRLHENSNFASRFKPIRVVQIAEQKYFRFIFSETGA